jgi:hypothetical protein
MGAEPVRSHLTTAIVSPDEPYFTPPELHCPPKGSG